MMGIATNKLRLAETADFVMAWTIDFATANAPQRQLTVDKHAGQMAQMTFLPISNLEVRFPILGIVPMPLQPAQARGDHGRVPSVRTAIQWRRSSRWCRSSTLTTRLWPGNLRARLPAASVEAVTSQRPISASWADRLVPGVQTAVMIRAGNRMWQAATVAWLAHHAPRAIAKVYRITHSKSDV
jgi:hypothetical protein